MSGTQRRYPLEPLPILRRIRRLAVHLSALALAGAAFSACGGDDESADTTTDPGSAKRRAPAVTETEKRGATTEQEDGEEAETSTEGSEADGGSSGGGASGRLGSRGSADGNQDDNVARPSPLTGCVEGRRKGKKVGVPPEPRLSARRLDDARVALTYSYRVLRPGCRPHKLRVITEGDGGGAIATLGEAKEYRVRDERNRVVLRLRRSEGGKQTIRASSITREGTSSGLVAVDVS